jgi:hypothetical protein
MPSWIISLLFATGVATWIYTKLAKANGNASPQSNLVIAGVAGLVIFIVFFTLLKVVLGF